MQIWYSIYLTLSDNVDGKPNGDRLMSKTPNFTIDAGSTQELAQIRDAIDKFLRSLEEYGANSEMVAWGLLCEACELVVALDDEAEKEAERDVIYRVKTIFQARAKQRASGQQAPPPQKSNHKTKTA
jgi:hypothetical protein